MRTKTLTEFQDSVPTDETHRATEPRDFDPRGYFTDDNYDDNFQSGRREMPA